MGSKYEDFSNPDIKRFISEQAARGIQKAFAKVHASGLDQDINLEDFAAIDQNTIEHISNYQTKIPIGKTMKRPSSTPGKKPKKRDEEGARNSDTQVIPKVSTVSPRDNEKSAPVRRRSPSPGTSGLVNSYSSSIKQLCGANSSLAVSQGVRNKLENYVKKCNDPRLTGFYELTSKPDSSQMHALLVILGIEAALKSKDESPDPRMTHDTADLRNLIENLTEKVDSLTLSTKSISDNMINAHAIASKEVMKDRSEKLIALSEQTLGKRPTEKTTSRSRYEQRTEKFKQVFKEIFKENYHKAKKDYNGGAEIKDLKAKYVMM